MWDTANQYVSTCDNSGIIPFILLIAVLVYAFKYVGRARRAMGKDKKRALFIWGVGAALFANAVAFFGISYFDQTQVAWYALLAMISAVIVVRPKKELSSAQLAAPSNEISLIPELVEQS
jgi:CDP-diglyceride synthetase